MLGLLASCSAFKGENVQHEYPIDPDDARRLERGRITGDGFKLFGGPKKNEEGTGTGGIGVNSYLWRAALDVISFAPIASADPMGGTIITDWHSTDANERYKFNVLILDTKLHSRALKVTAFKQERKASSDWQDSLVSEALTREIEDKILTKAREYKVRRINP